MFDVNTLATYRSVFCDGFSWSGTDTYVSVGEPRAVESGGLFATTLQAWRGDTLLAESRHVQRHHGTRELARRALRAAGLEALALYGSAADGSPRRPPDEELHTKTVVVARRPPAPEACERGGDCKC